MNVHKNARLTPYRRAQLVAQVEQGIPLTAAARTFGVSRQTAAKWRARQRLAGVPSDGTWMQDRSSRPHHSPRQTGPAGSSAPECCASSGGRVPRSPRPWA